MIPTDDDYSCEQSQDCHSPACDCELTDAGGNLDYDSLEYLNLPFPGVIPWFDAKENIGTVEGLLRERIPGSLHKLVINQLTNVGCAMTIAKAIASLKIQGVLPYLAALLLGFEDPETVGLAGMVSLSVVDFKARFEVEVGAAFLAAKLRLGLENGMVA